MYSLFIDKIILTAIKKDYIDVPLKTQLLESMFESSIDNVLIFKEKKAGLVVNFTQNI